LLFPALTLGGLVMALLFRQRARPARPYPASCVALFAALATATVGIFPNILPARDPSYALSIYDAAASREGLVVALWWWIPGILLVAGCFGLIHKHGFTSKTLK
jgi:cytochrome bd-type quinol oxidase subunit 2